ncbi:MAG: rane protein [Parcubacteria group bacterium]|nr:rane protein [Parcubacteria group bacterium]
MEKEKNIYEFFRVSVLLKGAFSVLEIIGGILILFVRPSFVALIVSFLTRGELMENPNDYIATQLVHLAHSFSASLQLFLAFYLLSRGIVKLGLVVALLKDKIWAYPVSLAVLGLFVLYQLYQIATQHSVIVMGITLFDLIVMYFIWREYKIARHTHT